MIEGGASLLQIERKTGVHRDTVERLCRAHGYPVERDARGTRRVSADDMADVLTAVHERKLRPRPHGRPGR